MAFYFKIYHLDIFAGSGIFSRLDQFFDNSGAKSGGSVHLVRTHEERVRRVTKGVTRMGEGRRGGGRAEW